MESVITETYCVGRVEGIRVAPLRGTNLAIVDLGRGRFLVFASLLAPHFNEGDLVAVVEVPNGTLDPHRQWSAPLNGRSYVLCTADRFGTPTENPADIARLSPHHAVGAYLSSAEIQHDLNLPRPMLVVSNCPLTN